MHAKRIYAWEWTICLVDNDEEFLVTVRAPSSVSRECESQVLLDALKQAAIKYKRPFSLNTGYRIVRRRGLRRLLKVI